ncbi:MAG TPA: phosphate ABC transporter permease PstA [Kiritimatiellia bacterium]|nr:phosphate ABC transporter permease PstA [Kiritimatiellia bacterium]
MKLPQHKLGNTRPAGETGVWLTSMGLSIGLFMVLALLGLIIYNGLGVFWPKPVVRIDLKPGSASIQRDQLVTGGIITRTRDRMIPQETGKAIEREWHIQTGNKDVYGQGFRYIAFDDAAATEFPSNAIVVERTEYGHAVGLPVALELPDGRRIEANADAFSSELRAAMKLIRSLRDDLRQVEKKAIGKINHAMTQLRLNPDELASPRGQQRQAELQQRYEVLAAEATGIRTELDKGRLHLRLFTGEERALPLGHVVYFHHPNRMTTAEKVGFFFHGIRAFVADEPREANTEGGIFPAIFGTFVMTLLMSIAVMPFGILAAIYLREYAKQGWFTRSVRISVNNLAGVPSIVFGVFGLGFFVYFTGGTIDQLFFSKSLPTPTFGTGGILWAALTLALMTVPVVIVSTEEALAAVPRGTREGSLALGASKWQTIYRIVLPAAAPGIMTGLVLAMARGAGEVAPLMLVGVVKLAPTLPIDDLFPFVHLDRKFMHLGFHIYDLGFQSPDSDAARPMVFATTLFLIALVVLLNLGAIIIRERLRRKYATGAF